MHTQTITRQTARRYVLGRQGLWPGRRWAGKEGTARALRQAEAVQIDTINVVARSHDLALWSRVVDYRPEYLDSLLYQERAFFDYGGILMIYPMSELPYWQTIMRRHQDRWAHHAARIQNVHDYVRQEIRTRGPLDSRDFIRRQRVPGGFHTVKDTAQALYHLWRSGELMTHSRRGFDRVFDFTENIAGRLLSEEAPTEADAERFFALKAMRDLALAAPAEWARRASVLLHRSIRAQEARSLLIKLTEEGELAAVTVEGRPETCYLPAADLPTLEALERGDLPDDWQPCGATTWAEVNFLAPLDNVIWDRKRTQTLLGFDYVWEVYKPAHQRRWGYYTLPILIWRPVRRAALSEAGPQDRHARPGRLLAGGRAAREERRFCGGAGGGTGTFRPLPRGPSARSGRDSAGGAAQAARTEAALNRPFSLVSGLFREERPAFRRNLLLAYQGAL